MMEKILKSSLIAIFTIALFTATATGAETIKTRIGRLNFTHDFANGYPTDSTVAKLFEEIDFQRACQAYIWALPLVSMAQWQYAHTVQLGAANGQIVFVESYDDKLGGLTYNVTTPYVIPFIDLSEGPWVTVMPQGEVRGAAHDMWQIQITQITEPGKYLFVGPGQEIPKDAEAEGFKVFQSPTNSLLLGIRLMPTDRDERMKKLAVKWLGAAFRAQPSLVATALRDSDLTSLGKDPEFRRLIAAAHVLEHTPSSDK